MTDRDRQIQIDTALWLAVTQGDDAGIARMLDAGANPNVKADGERSALGAAIQLQMFDVADQLLAAGGDVNYQQVAGVSPPLLVAALLRDVALNTTARVDYMLARGADLNARFNWAEEKDFTLRQLIRALPPFLSPPEREALARMDGRLQQAAAERQLVLQNQKAQQRRKKGNLRL